MTAAKSALLSHLAAPALLFCSTSCSTDDAASAEASPSYVGAAVCAECHAEAAQAWRGSHHDLAMQLPTEDSMLGDFADTEFEHLGAVTHFSRSGDDFIVRAEGPSGEQQDFRVAYTFGFSPLQQYLLEMPDGRLQSHTVPWDAESGSWYTLYPQQRHAVEDPLHWTGIYQNWNGMCAECHSTGLVKAYDEAADRFDTSFEEIDVACEACHGPGQTHVDWARGRDASDDYSADANGLTLHLRRDQQAAQINACAPCHSRRTPLTSEHRPDQDFFDNYQLELLRAGSYHDDGQILGEVYVYGSFAQSKMHASGVTCTDCHDPHSLELRLPGNGLCAQCHSPSAPVERFPDLVAKDYNTPDHHHHEAGTPGSACVDCHMPAQTYMGIDPRRDHSLRVPRPDLTTAIGTPNACDNCHADRGADWSAARVDEWFGTERQPHFGSTFAGARMGRPEALEPLIEIAVDPSGPAIVRATALELLRGTGQIGLQISQAVLADPSPLVRATAIRGLESQKPVERLNHLLPLIDDPSLSVRIEAARMLAGAPAQVLDAIAENYDSVLDEWRQAQLLSAEMPWAHHNLGSLEQDLGNTSGARDQYKRAIEIDPFFLPARFNLATLYNQTGRNLEAERVLRAGIELAPREGELHYSLGLLLAEVERITDAAESLLMAAELMPLRPRVHYNAGLALQRAGKTGIAERELLEANRLQADVPEVVHALASFYVSQELWALAMPHAQQLRVLVEDQPWVGELIEQINAGLALKN